MRAEDAVDVAVPEGLPLDPFNDQPFEFERLEDGIRISSPGPDPEVWKRLVTKNPDIADLDLTWELRDRAE